MTRKVCVVIGSRANYASIRSALRAIAAKTDTPHPKLPGTIYTAAEQIEAAGGRVLTPRTEIGHGMGAFAAFADPVGNEFGLYEEPR